MVVTALRMMELMGILRRKHRTGTALVTVWKISGESNGNWRREKGMIGQPTKLKDLGSTNLLEQTLHRACVRDQSRRQQSDMLSKKWCAW